MTRTYEARLTPRQQEVGELVAAGLSDREIAARLWVSRAAVRGHRLQIRRRTGEVLPMSRVVAKQIAHRWAARTLRDALAQASAANVGNVSEEDYQQIRSVIERLAADHERKANSRLIGGDPR